MLQQHGLWIGLDRRLAGLVLCSILCRCPPNAYDLYRCANVIYIWLVPARLAQWQLAAQSFGAFQKYFGAVCMAGGYSAHGTRRRAHKTLTICTASVAYDAAAWMPSFAFFSSRLCEFYLFLSLSLLAACLRHRMWCDFLHIKFSLFHFYGFLKCYITMGLCVRLSKWMQTDFISFIVFFLGGFLVTTKNDMIAVNFMSGDNFRFFFYFYFCFILWRFGIVCCLFIFMWPIWFTPTCSSWDEYWMAIELTEPFRLL